MMATRVGVYNKTVFERCWRGGAALLLASSFWLVLGARASAAQQIAVGPNPWLDVQLQSGTLTVNTWDRPDVQISTTGKVGVSHVPASVADSRVPHQYTAWSQDVATDRGDVKLPEESFVLPQLRGASHDAVVANGHGDTTITIPRGTALVTAHVGSGQLNLNGYHGAFITQVRDGGIALDHVSGSGYAEALTGRVAATSSTFDRLRVRTATGDMLFRDCTSHQIEATSKYGSIVYDNGKFQPGLARFESEHGNVALGVRGGAQIGAHSGAGHVVSSFHNGSPQQAPVVQAVSKHGSVFLYNGAAHAPANAYAPVRDNAAARTYGAPAHVFAPSQTFGAPHQYVAPRQYGAPRDNAPAGYEKPRRFTPQQQYAPPYQQRQGTPYGGPRQGAQYPGPRQAQYGGQRQQPPQQGNPPGSGGERRHKPPLSS